MGHRTSSRLAAVVVLASSMAVPQAFAASNPSTVPEPGTAWLVLLGSALAGLVRSRLRTARRG